MPQDSGGNKARFVWPPVRPPAQVIEPSAPSEAREDIEFIRPPAKPAPVGLRGALLEFERTWLGLTKPPLAERMAAADWKPDAPERYCPRCGSTEDSSGAPCDWCRDEKV